LINSSTCAASVSGAARAGVFSVHYLTRAVHAPAHLRAGKPDVIVTRLDRSARRTPIEGHGFPSANKEQKTIFPGFAAEGIIKSA
jgi:hypothetical protein